MWTIFFVLASMLFVLACLFVWVFAKQDTSYSQSENQPVVDADFDVGPITATEDNGWILNPKSPLPLTIYGVDGQIVSELRQILDEGVTKSINEIIVSLTKIITRTNLKCKEIEDYVEKFKPLYWQKIESLISSCLEWTTASDKDKEDFMEEFRAEAKKSVVIQALDNFEILFESTPKDVTFDDALIDEYGFENIRVYLRFAGRLNVVRNIPAKHRDRSIFENLVEKGLAIRGREINMELVLTTLKLKELNQLCDESEGSKFKRKAEAIDVLKVAPDIQERMGKIVALRELFQLKPLPAKFSHINLAELSQAWRYASEVAFLIQHTYTMGCYSAKDVWLNKKDRDYIKGWEISPGNPPCCQYCKQISEKKYLKSEKPISPFHIGCRCHVSPILEG